MTAGSGRKLCACLPKLSPIGLFSRILLESETWASTEYFLRWEGSATTARRSIFRLVPWTARSSETDIGSWGTPRVSRGQYMSGNDGKKLLTLEGQLATWPTPDASEAGKTSRSGDRKDEPLIGGLVRTTWPTPNASDGSGGPCNLESRKGHSVQLVDYIGQHPSGCLAQMERFVERLMNLSMWLMGYTAAYLVLWETASSRRSRKKS